MKKLERKIFNNYVVIALGSNFESVLNEALDYTDSEPGVSVSRSLDACPELREKIRTEIRDAVQQLINKYAK